MYHFGLDKNLLDYIVDDNPLKQGLYSPGLHIPIVDAARFYEDKPDYLLILAWNFSEEIMKTHQHFLTGGGRFIVPLPELKVVKRGNGA